MGDLPRGVCCTGLERLVGVRFNRATEVTRGVAPEPKDCPQKSHRDGQGMAHVLG